MSVKQKRFAWLIIIVIVSTLGVLGFASGRKAVSSTLVVLDARERSYTDSRRVDPPPHLATAQEGKPAGQRSQIRVEQLTLWQTGFKPAEITRPSGPLALIVVNNTRVRDISLQLNRETGNRLREVHLPAGKREWREYIDLAPGRYVITEGSHPDWTCRLNITPR